LRRNDAVYTCPFCLRKFRDAGSINRHLKFCFRENFRLSIVFNYCPACGKRFSTWRGLKWHIARQSLADPNDIKHALLAYILFNYSSRSRKAVSERVRRFLASKDCGENML